MYKKLRLTVLTTIGFIAINGYTNNIYAHTVPSSPAPCYDVYGIQTDPSHCEGPRPPAINCAHTHTPSPSESGGANGMSESDPGVSDAGDGGGGGGGGGGGNGGGDGGGGNR